MATKTAAYCEMLSTARLKNQLVINGRRVNRMEGRNLHRFFQQSGDFFDAFQTQQTNLLHGARSVFRGEV